MYGFRVDIDSLQKCSAILVRSSRQPVEFVTYLLKSVVFLPVGALVDALLIRLSARIVIRRSITFKAAFMLALITGAVLIVVGVILWPISSNLGRSAETAISLTVTIAIATWLFGYFLTNEDGRSIGVRKGFLVLLVSAIIFGAILFVIAAIVLSLSHAWKT